MRASRSSKFARWATRSLRRGLPGQAPGLRAGAVVMVVFAVLGNIPMFAGTDILKATTLSGTMVIGLAPVFVFNGAHRRPANFHLSFWTGMTIGIALATGLLPSFVAIGSGDYAMLLGANAWGLALCTLGFWLPLGRRT